MAQGYNLLLIPKDPLYRPTADQVMAAMSYLAERLEIEGDFSVDSEDELPLKAAIDRLRGASHSARGGTELTVTISDYLSTGLFGWEPGADDADDYFWSDELKLYMTAEPFPYADWEYEEMICPKCSGVVPGVAEQIEEIRLTGAPISCRCGKSGSPDYYELSAGVCLARFAVVFAGNKGWTYEVVQDSDAIKDAEFIPALEERLEAELDIMVVSAG